MKKVKIYFSISLLTIVSLYSVNSVAQSNKPLIKLETNDGNEFVGNIVSEDSAKVVIKTDVYGELPIRKDAITSRTEIDSSKIIKGKLWGDNPQATRYLWTPNGYGLKAGEGYYQNIWVLYNQVSVGITNNISFSAGTIPLFLFGAEATPIWIIPKFSIPIKKDEVNLSIGAFAGTILGEDDMNFGLAFSTITIGNRNQNLNFGLGWGFSSDGWAKKPHINVSAMARLTANGYFLTENYYIPVGGDFDLLVLSLGYRYMIKKVGIDFGLYMPFSNEMDSFVAIPTIGVTIPFGNSRANK